MKKKTCTFILFISILFLILLPSCKNNTDEMDIINESSDENENYNYNETDNTVNFKLDFDNGTITAEVNYTKSDLLGNSFLLNRDFTIQKIICDNNEINPEDIKELINYDDGYMVNSYTIPKFDESLKIQYTGFLSGETGYSPYVREKISPDFTFLRWETFYYPIFADNFQDTLEFLSSPLEAKITVNVPHGYLALSPLKLTYEITDSDGTTFEYFGNISDFNCAVSKYQKVTLTPGDFYFLENTDTEQLLEHLNSIIYKSQIYMNEHFGEAEISSGMRYIEIPDNFGSFALEKVVYIEHSAFNTELDMLQLVHEFIHLGWNPMSQDGEVQRSRFFDEGFTSYFTARVLGSLVGEDVYTAEIERCRESLKSKIDSDEYELVPVSQYGKYEYGDLSYIAGPVFFDEMSKLVGKEKFDVATRIFLQKYKDTSVDFDTMCKEYIKLCNNPELESFLNDWMFETEYYEKYIK